MPDTAENPPAGKLDGAPAAEPVSPLRRAGRLWSLIALGIREVSRDVASVASGRLFKGEAAPEDGQAPAEARKRGPAGAAAARGALDGQSKPDEAGEESALSRVRILQNVTERLRGMADSYIEAKLDEIEARVDEKLDAIENRIDQKLVNLHRQLAEMRDHELRHRLRLLKITLIFTVLVALLSLGYKWLSEHWI